jgi:hypothetical protein
LEYQTDWEIKNMTLFSFVLVLHVTAVFMLSAALSIEVLSLVHLRGASTPAEIYPWIDPFPMLPKFAVGSVIFILFSGIYLVIQESASGKAWPKVAASAFLLMGPLGAITARRMRAIRRSFSVEMALSSELIVRLRDPFFKISLGVRTAAFLGIFLLVSAKPGLWMSISLIGISVLLGLLLSLLDWTRNASLSVQSSSSPL